MPLKPSVLILLVCLSSLALADLAIVDVNLIDVEGDRVLPGQTILVEGGTITRIGPSASETIPSDAERIDGAGLYIIPGLWDMHAHMHSRRSPEFNMPLFIAHGVTGLREMNSPRPGAPGIDSTYEEKRHWAEEVEAGRLMGPRILAVASFPVNGPGGTGLGGIRPEEPSFFGAATPEDARELARYLKRQGVDLIKIYTGMPRDSFFALADEANKLGLQFGGHKPSAVSAIEASNAGMRTFEHARVFVYESFPGAAALRARSRGAGRRAMLAMVGDHDPSMADEIFETFVRNGTWFCPTHLTRKMDAFAGDEVYRADPRLVYIPGHYLFAWNRDADRYVDRDGTTRKRDAFMGVYLLGLKLTGRALFIISFARAAGSYSVSATAPRVPAK